MKSQIKITKVEKEKSYRKRLEQHKTRWLLVLAIVIPLLLLIVLTRFGAFDAFSNKRGKRITPVLSISDFTLKSEDDKWIHFNAFRGRWMLMYLNANQCAVHCLNSLNKIYEIRQALGLERTRVNALVITPTIKYDNPIFKILKQDDPLFRYGTINDQTLHKLIAELPQGTRPPREGGLYLIDPNGNIVISYSLNIAPKIVSKDIKKLINA